jgi:hypothetical protein
LQSTKYSDEKNKKGWKLFSSKNNSIQDSVGIEENGLPVPNPNKAMINVTNEPNDTYKKTPKPSKRKSWKKPLRNSWRRC